MDTGTIVLIIAAAAVLLLAGGFVAMLIVTKPIALKVYEEQLVRTSADKWGRACSEPGNEEQFEMWNRGLSWAAKHSDKMKEVQIKNDGLKLMGEFYDFGSKRCAIILPGRCESLKYSYYFAAPYEAMGMNILVADARAHGFSEGKYSTIGVKESGDLKAWITYIEKEFGIEEIWLHGVCIGSASAILLMSSVDCPKSVKGMVTEGPFVSFRETFKRHMTDINRPWFPVLDEVMMNIKKYGGGDVYKGAPIRHIGKVKQNVLMLFGKQDKFSVPKKSQILFNKCGSTNKKLVWFEKGGHSHLRINNEQEYDKAIIDYVESCK